MNILLAILLPMLVTGICFSWSIGWPALGVARSVPGSIAHEYPITCKWVSFLMATLFTPVTLVLYIVPSFSAITYDSLIVEFSKRADEE